MSLIKDNFFYATELNTLRDRLVRECYRRSREANAYNTDPIVVPTIEDAVSQNIFQAQYLNKFLTQLYEFNVFPGANLLDISYHDGRVEIGDIIYAIENFNTIIQKLENEPRKNNDDCKTGCRGLCTNSCRNQCDGCTGCTSCSGCTSCAGCYGTCSGCWGTCEGCTGGCNSCQSCEGCWGASGGGPGGWW